MQRRILFALAALIGLASVAQASATISVGAHDLLPNTPGQVISIFATATGGDTTQGMNFLALVADGGPLNTLTGPGTILGPAITSVNIIGAGMLFAPPNNTGQGDETSGGFGPQGTSGTTTTPTAPIGVAAGQILIGTITISTVGFPALAVDQTWDLNIGGANNPTSHFLTDFDSTAINGVELSILDGSITIPKIVPEPSSIVMGAFALVGLGMATVYRRRRA